MTEEQKFKYSWDVTEPGFLSGGGEGWSTIGKYGIEKRNWEWKGETASFAIFKGDLKTEKGTEKHISKRNYVIDDTPPPADPDNPNAPQPTGNPDVFTCGDLQLALKLQERIPNEVPDEDGTLRVWVWKLLQQGIAESAAVSYALMVEAVEEQRHNLQPYTLVLQEQFTQIRNVPDSPGLIWVCLYPLGVNVDDNLPGDNYTFFTISGNIAVEDYTYFVFRANGSPYYDSNSSGYEAGCNKILSITYDPDFYYCPAPPPPELTPLPPPSSDPPDNNDPDPPQPETEPEIETLVAGIINPHTTVNINYAATEYCPAGSLSQEESYTIEEFQYPYMEGSVPNYQKAYFKVILTRIRNFDAGYICHHQRFRFGETPDPPDTKTEVYEKVIDRTSLPGAYPIFEGAESNIHCFLSTQENVTALLNEIAQYEAYLANNPETFQGGRGGFGYTGYLDGLYAYTAPVPWDSYLFLLYTGDRNRDTCVEQRTTTLSTKTANYAIRPPGASYCPPPGQFCVVTYEQTPIHMLDYGHPNPVGSTQILAGVTRGGFSYDFHTTILSIHDDLACYPPNEDGQVICLESAKQKNVVKTYYHSGIQSKPPPPDPYIDWFGDVGTWTFVSDTCFPTGGDATNCEPLFVSGEGVDSTEVSGALFLTDTLTEPYSFLDRSNYIINSILGYQEKDRTKLTHFVKPLLAGLDLNSLIAVGITISDKTQNEIIPGPGGSGGGSGGEDNGGGSGGGGEA